MPARRLLVVTALLAALALWNVGSAAADPPPATAFAPVDLPSPSYQDWNASIASDPANITDVYPGDSFEDAFSLAEWRRALLCYFLGQPLSTCDQYQDVRLRADATYTIDQPLSVPSGIRLRGKRGSTGFEQQQIVPSATFPTDTPMVKLSSDTVAQDLRLNANNIAWRGIESNVGADDVTIRGNLVRRTRHDIGVAANPSPGTARAKTHLVEVGQLSERTLVQNNKLEYSGLHPVEGRSNSPRDWSSFSAGIDLNNAQDVSIIANEIDETATAGIVLFRSDEVNVYWNTISNVSRNSEWWSSGGQVVLGDGITGYNNLQGSSVEEDRDWRIWINSITNSGNHGVHVSGRTISIRTIATMNTQQIGVFLGETLGGPPSECNEWTLVESHDYSDQYQPRYASTPTPPSFSSSQNEGRNYDYEGTQLVSATDFINAGAVNFNPSISECDVKLPDNDP